MKKWVRMSADMRIDKKSLIDDQLTGLVVDKEKVPAGKSAELKLSMDGRNWY